MRELDRRATLEYGIPSLVLMENAGKGTAELILKQFPKAQKILVVSGKGNNGGDGFVTARYLKKMNREPSVLLLADPSILKGDAKINFDRLFGDKIPVTSLDLSQIEDCDLLVDAILGIGVTMEVKGIYRDAIERMNQSGKPILAVDIPSGLDGDSGQVHGVAVRSTCTATMAELKHGLLSGAGPQFCGSIFKIDIGFPKQLCPS